MRRQSRSEERRGWAAEAEKMAALEESFGSELFRYEEHCLRRQPCGFCFRKGCGGEWEKDKEDVQRRGVFARGV